MFQLTKNEIDAMLSQNAIPSRKSLGGHLPYAFTQEGVAMLSTVLRSGRAVATSIGIMRVFVKLREIIISNEELHKRIEKMEKDYTVQFKAVFAAIKQLMDPKVDCSHGEIGFKYK